MFREGSNSHFPFISCHAASMLSRCFGVSQVLACFPYPYRSRASHSQRGTISSDPYGLPKSAGYSLIALANSPHKSCTYKGIHRSPRKSHTFSPTTLDLREHYRHSVVASPPLLQALPSSIVLTSPPPKRVRLSTGYFYDPLFFPLPREVLRCRLHHTRDATVSVFSEG